MNPTDRPDRADTVAGPRPANQLPGDDPTAPRDDGDVFVVDTADLAELACRAPWLFTKPGGERQ